MEQLQLSLGESRRKRRRRTAAKPKDAAFAEALGAAREILQWRLGPNPPEWRVLRLANAMIEQAQ